MTTLETNKGRIMAVEVPLTAFDIDAYVVSKPIGYRLGYWQRKDNEDEYHITKLSEECELFGTVTSGVPDFDTFDYVTDAQQFQAENSKSEAFRRILKKNGIDYENRKIVILKIK